MISITYTPQTQASAKLALPDLLNPPPAFDAKHWPILARHWFGIVPLFAPVTRERDAAGASVGVEAEAA